MKKFTMNIPKDLHKELKLWCVQNEKEMAEVICKLIVEFLEKEKKKLKK
jgi:hypothetical protein